MARTPHRLAAAAGVAPREAGGEGRGAVGMARTPHRLAAAAGVAAREAGGEALDADVRTGAVRQCHPLSVDVPGGETPVLVTTGEGAGEPAGRPALLAGQGIAPAAATIDAVNPLGLDLVSGAGVPAATVPGAGCARLMFLRDHGSRPWTAVLRTASSTPRPVPR
jgi:gamma-glutamyltranspeptidase/glutathione hydrolase